jgi:hypothetical protein
MTLGDSRMTSGHSGTMFEDSKMIIEDSRTILENLKIAGNAGKARVWSSLAEK